ncbi:sn-glycerol 3-phosphate transport system substrate-binding protein [Herbaspirillum sp. Sphag1AN]|uniref:sn-glycerol-3-phosphate ABC transporter substrate-binding protein UgpB n=1 Tax=unclassified Herbaspirillum TaxID=2624150 RepID=UPI001610C23E|nr:MULTISPECIES: sn-glycerol-3-phosphate ABC transporter substrate-binding protein UgpB [unclassified Herbaspirillum]MBB3214564.1 sn-glycerol 3-phosphate transport system substrate-binding protein [Herbaspirillum sp. Sphag1AN]MBB3247710.1 sn-glycerol 3-phosphate transport system substrate-binding protein [Herbaspirillum sp. Sphag64]
MNLPFKTLVAAAALATMTSSAYAVTEISFWHSMTGALNDRVNVMADEFNKGQSEFKVVPVFKGTYDESMAAAIAAYRAGNAPDILQIFEVGTATMIYSKGAVKPVYEVMQQAGEKFDQNAYVPAVAGYYSTPKGLMSFPFNSSTTIMFYNKDLFVKAGLDPNKPPVTWQDFVGMAAKLKASGTTCPYTTTWQSWVQLESFSAWHNTESASKNNGFGGLDARLKINGPLQVRHIENLANWAKQGYFVYAGRKDEANAKFNAGECAIITGSSSAYADIRKNAKFKFGVAPLPYYSDVPGAPQNTIIGGASLWVMGGKKAEEYKGVAKFLTYLSKPEVQAKWHQETGYLPVTKAAYELTKKSGFYEQNPGTDVAVKQMIVKTTDKSRGLRLGNYAQIRTVIDEELENVWSGKKTAKEALDSATKRGDELLTRFEKANK